MILGQGEAWLSASDAIEAAYWTAKDAVEAAGDVTGVGAVLAGLDFGQ